MGHRITGLRAITVTTAIAVVGLAIPAALIAATSSEPAPIPAAAFAPVLSMAWMERFTRANAPYQVLLAAGHTRAPPA